MKKKIRKENINYFFGKNNFDEKQNEIKQAKLLNGN
jgi:hypothetical protein